MAGAFATSALIASALKGETEPRPAARQAPLAVLQRPAAVTSKRTEPAPSGYIVERETLDDNTPPASPGRETLTSKIPQGDAAITTQQASDNTVTFAGRPLRIVKAMSMEVTAYSPDARSCGIWADGYTASGKSVETNGGFLVAADTKLLPFGTLVAIPGYNDGKPVPVLDRGGAIKGQKLDLLYPTHERALKWGRQHLEVVVYEYADE